MIFELYFNTTGAGKAQIEADSEGEAEIKLLAMADLEIAEHTAGGLDVRMYFIKRVK